MQPQTSQAFELVTRSLVATYVFLTGSNTVDYPPPTLAERQIPMPPLKSDLVLGLPMQTLLDMTLLDTGFGEEVLVDTWTMVAAMVKDQGWRTAASFRRMLTGALPGLGLRKPPRGTDVRGELLQFLSVGTHLLPHCRLVTSPSEVFLHLSTGRYLALTERSITWPNGHYLKRSLGPIDFTQWLGKPFAGHRSVDPRNAALLRRLQAVMPEVAQQLEIFFVLAAILGRECEELIRDPFLITYVHPEPDALVEHMNIQTQLRGY